MSGASSRHTNSLKIPESQRGGGGGGGTLEGFHGRRCALDVGTTGGLRLRFRGGGMGSGIGQGMTRRCQWGEGTGNRVG